jgi:hypothetical protein
VAGNAVALKVPEPALAAVGSYQELEGELVVLAEDHLFASGARGLASGRFLDGSEQLFVGSASTLEVLNPDGSVALRRAVPKGIPQYFQLIPGPGDSQNLLIGNKPSSQMDLAVINSETPRETTQSFYEVPEGHTYIRNWARMRRRHIFYEDVDGDGNEEIASEITGFWNRVSIWESDGTPISNVQIGPGKRMPEHAIRDFDVADLEGDGTKEILVGKIDGDLVVLDHQLELVWSKVLKSVPEVLTTVRPEGQEVRRIVVGLEDGTILMFDRQGNALSRGSIEGRPTEIAVVDGPRGPRVVFGTDEGVVAAFAVD